jgi:hypothetical protein
MSATLHTELPDEKGHGAEREFLERLVELGDKRTHIWGNVDYLPGVADLDAILLKEDIGFFTIEVKGIRLNMIREYNLAQCRIEGRKGLHPVKQIAAATLDLRCYLDSFSGVRRPFFSMTAAFPKITRQSFLRRFDEPQIHRQAESLVFAEDLESATALWRRLLVIRQTPARGRGIVDAVPSRAQIDRFADLIKPGPLPTPTQADQIRGGILRRQVTSPSPVSRKYLEPGSREATIFRGAPGTGKTVRLQEIAIAHARAGRAVLFTCYNRVLASTLRGIMASQNLGEEVNRRLVVVHVDELRRQLADDLDTFVGLFQTVCVDEGQDMEESAFSFLAGIAEPQAEWFIADGPGQELYGPANRLGEPAPFLAHARSVGTVETLRRNYRNSSAGFLVAQAVFEGSPDKTTVGPWVSRHPLKIPAENQDDMLDLEGTQLAVGGELPQVVRLVVPSGSDWRLAKLHAYVAIFNGELEKLAAEGKRRDLAILCARGDSKSSEPQLAREALEMLHVPFHDQIDGRARDVVVPEDHVRLTTIHSSRGIEASRVVILDFDRGVSSSDGHARNSRIMSYIALSRGQIGTTVVALEDANNPHLAYLEEVVKAYRS